MDSGLVLVPNVSFYDAFIPDIPSMDSNSACIVLGHLGLILGQVIEARSLYSKISGGSYKHHRGGQTGPEGEPTSVVVTTDPVLPCPMLRHDSQSCFRLSQTPSLFQRKNQLRQLNWDAEDVLFERIRTIRFPEDSRSRRGQFQGAEI